MRPFKFLSPTANRGFPGGYIVFPGPLRIPAETHERPQPLQFEALNASNARKTAITGIPTAAFDPTGGVPQPAPFPIAKTVLPNPTADPGPGQSSLFKLRRARCAASAAPHKANKPSR